MRLKKKAKAKISKYQGPPWDVIRRLLKERFLKAGIIWCELNWEGCEWPNNPTFAHSLRRRLVKTVDQMAMVIRACQSCHQKLDKLEHEETYKIVAKTIKDRVIPVEKIHKYDYRK